MPATRNDNRSGAKALPIESGSLQWLTILAFLTASALIFLLLSEWGRYQIILGTKSNTLSYVDSALILWLLTAKSLACFLPVLPLLALLIAAGYRRAVDVVLIVSWVGIFFFMAGDLIAVSFQGYHLWDYLPYVYDMVRSPSQRIWQWAGNDFGTQTALLMLLLVVAGPVLLVSVGWIVRQAAHRWQGVCQRHVSVVLTAMFLFIHLG
ncbi:MAG: hypothetical protein FJY85_03290, partial [Deltaproteobacteria bacterium]|nr:hypothetical protein [Deltaproteobacteria bacterium]